MSDHFIFSKQKTKYLKDIVYENIKNAILENQLPAGTRLLEVEIANQMGISRGPVRNALKTLQNEGFIYTHSNKGIIVAERNLEERNLVFVPIRRIIECHSAIQAAINFTQDDYDQLQEIIDSLKNVCEKKDLEAMAHYDFAFHDYIVSNSTSTLIISIWHTIIAQVNARIKTWSMELNNFDEIVNEHVEQLEAIKSGDKDLINETFSKYIY